MRLVIDFDGIRREIDVARAEAGVTLADIIVKASGSGVADDETVWVDDRRHAAGDLVSDVLVLEGSSLSREPAAPIEPMAGWSLSRSGGMQAGQVLPVPEQRALAVGRSPQADITLDSPSASWSHLTVERDGDGVRVRDAGSTNGTFVNGVQADADGILVELDAVVLAGGTALLLRQQLPETPAPRPGSLHNLTAAGTAPFNRPPRPGLLAKPSAVVPPTRKEVAPASKFSIITVVGPLAIAAGMVVLLHNVAYAAVALLSPVLAVGTWFEQRRRRSKESAGEQSRFTQTLDTFRDDLRRAADVERRRRADESPDPATMLRRACLPATTLWQRRHSSPDFLSLHAGVGDVPWEPEIDRQGGSRLDDDAQRLVDDSRIVASPVQVDLTGAGVVGIVGNRADALAVARSLLMQASIHCGPADLTVVMCCDQGREAEWEWTAWLPQTRRAAEGSADLWVSAQQSRSESLLRTLRDGIDQLPTPAALLVLDTDVLLEGRDSAARALLGHGRPSGTIAPSQPGVQVSGIVVASSEEQLPASCTVVIHAGQDAEGTVSRPHDRAHVDDVILAGVDVPTARAGAIQLARFDDPELIVADARLPAVVRLNPLLGLDTVDAETILKRWASATGVATPIGMGEKGQFSLDLVHDGPHGLVGGTTGSGKSEFLRSLVAGLAASNPPSKLTFILIDFKGGAAFATCERLPHTIGTVSNLDEQLADRALRALEAEMQYRQRVFAAAGEGIDNLDAYLATNPREPMPRLLLVVDEFAMLAKDYPDVLSSLVSVAAVGRTLGVHMILATQRPAGVVNDDILANTNLRVALRVQSREDSTNVIGVANASAIGRGQWGRAFIKLGQDDITPVQTALSTGPLADAVAEPLEVHPVVFGRPTAPAKPTAAAPASSQTDLDVLIDAIAAASDQAGFVPPRPVWPEPLGARITLAGFTGEAPATPTRTVGGCEQGSVVFALSDDPDRQRQITAAWNVNRGNLLLAGIPGSGTSTALTSLALTLAQNHAPDELDLLILDMGSRDLAPLTDLPHTVGYVGSGSAAREQQVRLLKYLRGELDRRKTAPGPHRKTVVLIDGLAALRDEFQDFEGVPLIEGLYRAYADGPEVGIHFALTTSRIKAIPSAIDEVTTQKWLFHLADHYDYTGFGLKPTQIPAHVAGRCVLVETKLQTHVATPDMPVTAAVAQVTERWGDLRPKQSLVRQLPDTVTVAELGASAALDAEPWRIPVGIRETDLRVGYLDLYEGEHLLVAGPVRSGKSTRLLALAESLRTAATPAQVWGVCGRRSPLADSPLLDRVAVGTDDLPALAAAARIHRGPLVLLIDDAEQFDDADHTITQLVQHPSPTLHIIAAGRADDLRSIYGHWTKLMRKARAGILLQPDTDYDGDLLSVKLPRTSPVALTPGRGYACIGGTFTLVQASSPSV